MIFYLFIPVFLFSQKEDFSNCESALTIAPKGNYTLSFMGKKGLVPSNGLFLHTIAPTKNQLWINFTTINKGRLSISFDSQQDNIQLLILKENESDLCLSLYKQNLPVLLEKTLDNTTPFDTELKVDDNDKYLIVFIAPEKSIQKISCAFSFFIDEAKQNKYWPLNLVYNESLPVYRLVIRDKQTHLPVEARIVLQGTPEINGIYRASDLTMNLTKKTKDGIIRIDAEGYLSSDIEKTSIPFHSSFNDTIWLQSIEQGMMAELDDVYFVAGLSTVLEESYPKLKRLRDFLVLNPSVSIEIHGHVNEDNDKDIVSMRLSKKRAKKVVDYLVEGGIEPKRLTAIGFGNTRPIYKDPKTEEEKEANRRVEILIQQN